MWTVPCNRYTSFAFTSRLLEAGVDASVGSVGDGYDNALAETTIGLFKTKRSTVTGRGRRSPTSKSPRWNGSTGTTTPACTPPAAGYRRSSTNSYTKALETQ
jgi:putative transposase